MYDSNIKKVIKSKTFPHHLCISSLIKHGMKGPAQPQLVSDVLVPGVSHLSLELPCRLKSINSANLHLQAGSQPLWDSELDPNFAGSDNFPWISLKIILPLKLSLGINHCAHPSLRTLPR